MLSDNDTRVERTIAYFSMEIGLDAEMPTYSGGLGVLAGDTIRAAADLNVPMVAVTLLHRKGYFHQRISPDGSQIEEPVKWVVRDFMRDLPLAISVQIEDRMVRVLPWEYEVKGAGGFVVPVYFLDTDLPENSEWDRRLTDYLYGGDQYYRLCQEIILGIGGVRTLQNIGYSRIRRFHMNEGHAAFLTLELLEQEARANGRIRVSGNDIEAVRSKCIFTTHTPVPAGHDQFPLELIERIGNRKDFLDMEDVYSRNLAQRVLGLSGVDWGRSDPVGAKLNMTLLALNMSHYVNGVAKSHGEVSKKMFAEYEIHSITNGVHAATWTGPDFQKLYDQFIPGWRTDNFSLRYALSIPKELVWNAHREQKNRLIEYVNRGKNVGMSVDVMTIGFARRSAEYKRGDLFFSDLARLRKISSEAGRLQVIYAGKAHPKDEGGKELIRRIHRAGAALSGDIEVVYLENYDIDLGKLITSGVDLWLNTPQPPMEASGTSGMKAALNGVPSLSILDGWWIEGCIEGLTGWSIGGGSEQVTSGVSKLEDAVSLYDKLEGVIVPLYYKQRDRFIDVMAHCIAINGSFFNTQRMLLQYVLNAYL